MGTLAIRHARPAEAGGFTLIEAVMVIVLIGILAAVGAPMIANGMRLSFQTRHDLETTSQLRYATERIAREVREIAWAGSSYNISTMSASQLAFVNGNGTAVSISRSGTAISLGYGAIGSASLTSQAAAPPAEGLRFTYRDFDGVETTSPAAVRFVDIAITLANPTTGATYTQRTRVALRNAT